MRRLVFYRHAEIPTEVFHLVSLGSTEGVLCPGLRDLYFKADPYTLPFYRLFLSRKITRLSLTYSSLSRESPEKELSIIQPVIMGLDTFPLRYLRLSWQIRTKASMQVESVISSAVLRCGPALQKLYIFSPLSDAAVQHIMQLPNLDTWLAMNGPPRIPNLSLTGIFPKLNDLSLVSESSLEWLTLLTTAARHIPSDQNFHSPLNCGPVQTLSRLKVFPEVPINSVFVTPIMLFRELISLRLTSACPNGLTAAPRCAFSLTDDNISDIAAALPRLEVASLGVTCSANTCQTTIASLVSFSTRCSNLELSEFHFNTTNLRNNLESVSADPRLDRLPSLRTHGIFRLSLSGAPYTISKDDVVPVLKGLRRIFPSLTRINGNDTWEKLNSRLREV